jgi:hypothetical protein
VGELNAMRGFLNCKEERGFGGKRFSLEERLVCSNAFKTILF